MKLARRLPAVAVAAAFAAAAGAQQDCIFPPVPEPDVVQQPDGTELALRLRASESARWYEDEAGYPVVRTDAGYVYATLDAAGNLAPTEHAAGRGDPAALGISRRVRPGPPRGAARKEAGL